MKAQEIMTPNPACCTPNDSVQEAARLMEQHDCGCLPVVEDTEVNRLMGVVTDRDLALRALAAKKGPETKVRDVMSTAPSCCTPDDDVDTVERIMAERQVRRVPVIDRAGCCVGIIAQADIARENSATTDREVARVVERVSEPTRESRRDVNVGIQPEQRL
jgi:CBS domain-containing protein